jgi:hypothetical protein
MSRGSHRVQSKTCRNSIRYRCSSACVKAGSVRSRGGRPIAGATALIERLPVPVDRAHGDLLGEARRLYDQMQYGRAILYLFAYELLQLDRHHVIRLARGKTNRQYLRELTRVSPLSPPLERTMVAFESVFFGRQALDRGGFEACWQELPQFENLLRGAT